MNNKAAQFDVLVEELNKEGNTWFIKDVVENDELGTVVYHGHLNINDRDLPVFVVLDNSVFSFVRVALTTNGVDKRKVKTIVTKLNELNQTYKAFKYYLLDSDSNIYLDASVPTGDDNFDPALLVNLLLQVVRPHLVEVHEDVLAVAGQK